MTTCFRERILHELKEGGKEEDLDINRVCFLILSYSEYTSRTGGHHNVSTSLLTMIVKKEKRAVTLRP